VLDLANLENADLEKTGLDELATFSMEETGSKIAWADDQTVVTLKDEQETSRNSV